MLTDAAYSFKGLYRVGLGLVFLTVLMSLPLPFFWDSILLGSEVGQHFYREGLGAWILPAALDSGHPPFFGWYLALFWKLFGLSLPIAHLAMLPWLLLIWWSYFQLLKSLIPASALSGVMLPASLLLLLEPTFLAQAIHVAPDIPLLAFYLCGLLAVLRKKPVLFGVCLLGMGMISLRGCFGMLALWVTALYLHQLHYPSPEKSSPGERIRAWGLFKPGLFIPALISAGLVLSWHLYHASKSGYFLVNPNSSWSEAQSILGWQGMLRNAGLIVWRSLDFGRLVLWIPGLIWMAQMLLNARRGEHPEREERALLAIFLLPLLVYTLAYLPFANPIAHRYLLPVFVLALPWFAYRISVLHASRRSLYFIAMVAILGFGHRWIYPDKTAQGWDASLAHLPYFSLMSQAWSEIPDPGSVYTEFPLYKPMQSIRPGSQQQRESFNKASGDWLDHNYILYSNIINDIPDATYDEISKVWPLQREWTQGRVFIRLYRKPGVVPMELPERLEH